MDAATHRRIEEILKQRIALGDGDSYGMDRRSYLVRNMGSGRKKKRATKKKGGLGVGGAAKKNPWISFLKKHSGKGLTRKELLEKYHKTHKKAKVGAKRKAKGGAKRKPVRRARGGANPYIAFLKKHAGQGYTRQELVRMYKQY